VPDAADRIDAVYTWVDGSWPGYQDELARHAGRPVDLNPNRYRDNLDLLKYSLRSLDTFAPWIERVHLVTARPQVPSWLNRDAPGLRIVHHDELFAPRHLPTYCSFAIETHLFMIPGLSPRFLYLNDDMLLGRTLDRSDLITEDGRARFHLEWNRTDARRSDSHPWRAAIGHANELLDQTFTKASARPLVRHAPVLMEIVRWRELAERFASALEATRSAKFRSGDAFAPEYLYPWFCLETGHAVRVPVGESYRRASYIGVDNRRWLVSLQLAIVNRLRPVFLTLNDNFDENASESVVALVRGFLESWFPTPSRFEFA
jgi:hypothetical protein